MRMTGGGDEDDGGDDGDEDDREKDGEGNWADDVGTKKLSSKPRPLFSRAYT